MSRYLDPCSLIPVYGSNLRKTVSLILFKFLYNVNLLWSMQSCTCMVHATVMWWTQEEERKFSKQESFTIIVHWTFRIFEILTPLPHTPEWNIHLKTLPKWKRPAVFWKSQDRLSTFEKVPARTFMVNDLLSDSRFSLAIDSCKAFGKPTLHIYSC